MRIKSVLTHSLQAIAKGSLIALLVVGLTAGTALAGKPGGSTTSKVRVDNGVYAGTTTAYAGPASATWVHAKCYQSGTLVFEQYVPFSSGRTAVLQLGPTPMWAGGAATCSAEDGYWFQGTRWRITSTNTFSVAAT